MNTKKLFVVEILSIAVVLAAVMFFVEVSPYLSSSKPDSQIGVYTQKDFADDTVTLAPGQAESARFNYSTYDPAILVVYLTFPTYNKVGDLSVYINGNYLTTVNAPPGTFKFTLTAISFSGQDWVKSPSINTFTYGNEITFVSEPTTGYDGTVSYRISIRGSK